MDILTIAIILMCCNCFFNIIILFWLNWLTKDVNYKYIALCQTKMNKVL